METQDKDILDFVEDYKNRILLVGIDYPKIIKIIQDLSVEVSERYKEKNISLHYSSSIIASIITDILIDLKK